MLSIIVDVKIGWMQFLGKFSIRQFGHEDSKWVHLENPD